MINRRSHRINKVVLCPPAGEAVVLQYLKAIRALAGKGNIHAAASRKYPKVFIASDFGGNMPGRRG